MATESSASLTDWNITFPVKKSDNEVFHPSDRMLVYTATYSGVNDIRRAKVRILVDDVEINNGSELIVDPDLGGSTVFTFDISKIVENYVSSVLPTLGTASGSNISADNISADVRISIADVSLVSNTLTTGTYRTMGASDEIVVFKGGYDDSRIHDGDFIDTDNDGVRLRPYMSNKPLKVRATPTDNIFIGVFKETSFTDLDLDITTYIGASSENTYSKTWTTSTLNDTSYVGIGPANIEAQSSSIITDSTTHYTVRLRYGVTSGRTYTVVLDRDCNDSYTELCFLNEYGFFDYYLFRGDKIRKLKADHGYIKKPRTLSRTSTISDRLKESTGVAYDINYSISTGLVKKEVSVWLEELYTSPEVYIIENGNYFPIEVLSQSVTTEDKNKDIVNMAIEYRYVQNKR
jgi:hypothetical protein